MRALPVSILVVGLSGLACFGTPTDETPTDKDAEADADTDVDGDTDSDTDTDTDTDVDADSDTDTDADTDADADSDADADADVDPNDRDDDGDGYSENDGDCNDSRPNINPDAEETCNGQDDDCDSLVDEGDVCGGSGGDTALVYLIASGSWSVPGGSFDAVDMGYAAWSPLTGDIVCDIRSDYDEVGAGQSGCPDCDWAFEVTPDPRPTDGDLCDEIFAPGYTYSMFSYYEAADFWIGDGRLDGVGTSPDYTYSGSVDYYLGQTFFVHYTYGRYNGWYFQAWNLPDYGYYQVYGDSEYATWARFLTSGGSAIYYYYYY